MHGHVDDNANRVKDKFPQSVIQDHEKSFYELSITYELLAKLRVTREVGEDSYSFNLKLFVCGL